MNLIYKTGKLFSPVLMLFYLAAGQCYFVTAARSDPSAEKLQAGLNAHLGKRDAAIVAAPDGRILAGVREEQLLIPASILKVLTSLAALAYLGPDYHYPTDFFLSPDGDLKVKGYGDPFLVSERLQLIADQLAKKTEFVEDLILDDSHFSPTIRIPGRHVSIQPYDAPNGALCVNFNTVFFKRQNGRWVSAEPQTPLLPFVIPKIEASGLKAERITFAAGSDESLRYAGELLAYFMDTAGLEVNGGIVRGRIDIDRDKLLWRYLSPDPLTQVVANLLEYSNNFIANQLMLTMGVKVYGPPATVEKGLNALRRYYETELGLTGGYLAEASGISRRNRITAIAMLRCLERFAPHYRLLRHDDRQWYKTGTLKGIRTRAGYLESRNGGHYRFVVMLNTPGKTTDRIMRLIENSLE